MKKVTVEMFEANDGQQFDSAQGCLFHELVKVFNEALFDHEHSQRYYNSDAGFSCIDCAVDFCTFVEENPELMKQVHEYNLHVV